MMTGQKELNQEKQQLRARMKEVREAIPAQERQEQNEALTKIILGTELYNTAQYILTYVSYGSEVDTLQLMHRAIRDGKKVFVPKVFPKSHTMDFFLCEDPGALRSGIHGIPEPEADPTKLFPYSMHLSLNSAENCMMLVPGLAFDEKLGRIGYGGGYYDRYLRSFHKKMTVGMAFNEQIVEEVPMGTDDVPLDLVVTPQRAYF